MLEGFKKRRDTTDSPLNIILCENLKGAASRMRELINNKITPELKIYSDEKIGFINTVIGRMVPMPTEEMKKEDPTLVRVEPYKELPVDKTLFKGSVPNIEAMIPEENFKRYTARKLYIHNAGHALLAYSGFLKDYNYGWQALNDPSVNALVKQGMSESRDGIIATLNADKEWLDEHIQDLLQRFTNKALGDTIFRLGRDPIRKLSPNDRLVGAAQCAIKGKEKPHALATGIALAFKFNSQEDEVAVQLQKQLQKDGFEKTLKNICDIAPSADLGQLICEKYKILSDQNKLDLESLLS